MLKSSLCDNGHAYILVEGTTVKPVQDNNSWDH